MLIELDPEVDNGEPSIIHLQYSQHRQTLKFTKLPLGEVDAIIKDWQESNSQQ